MSSYSGSLCLVKVLGLLIALLCPTVTLEALNPEKQIHQYNLDFWSTEQGLPQSSVMTMVQAVDGYLWLGTQEGLARFDGIDFTVFDKSNTKAFEDNHVVRLNTGSDGTIWIATHKDIVAYRQSVFTAIRTPTLLQRTQITTLHEDTSGTLWIGTVNCGLLAYRKGQFTFYTTKQGLSGDSITCLAEDRQGRLLVGVSGGGVVIIDEGGLQILPLDDGTTTYTPSVVFMDSEGDLWIGTSDEGLFHYRINEGDWHRYVPDELDERNSITALLEDSDRNLWIGTGNGLFRLKNDDFDSITSQSGLSHNAIESLLEDDEGNIWVGTYGGGVNRLKDGNVVTYGTALGLSHEDVLGLFEDNRDNAFWVATSGGGLNKFEGRRFTTPGHDQGLPLNIYTVCRDRRGTLWVGSREGLFTLIGDDQPVVERFANIPMDIVILSLFEDSRGRVWCGTESNFLYVIEKGTVTHLTNKDGLRGASIVAITEDRHGTIWIGTDGNGLNSFDGSGFVNYTSKDGLPSNDIMCLYLDGRENLWIGTYSGGLACFRNGRIRSWTMNDGLLSDSIFCILEDNAEALWMSCNKGIFTISKEDLLAFQSVQTTPLSVRVFGIMDGMKSAECNGGFQPAGWKRRDGSLWFPTINGVVSVLPSAMRVNPHPPRVTIERSLVDGVPLFRYSDHVLPAGSDKLEFHFAGLSYTAPERINYYYRLDGYDSEWVMAGARRVAYYTNIEPGEYVFQVYACNNDGFCTEQSVSVAFNIKPFFYQTSWFLILCSVLALLIVGATIKLRTHSIELRNRELNRLVDERKRELIEANVSLEKAKIAHEHMSITDPLTGIANRRHFDEVFSTEWQRAIALSKPISFIIADIDFFKDYNDGYGHQAGDDCLIQVATAIRSQIVRSSDLVGRYGGEEFAFCLVNTDAKGAVIVGDNVRAAVESLAIPHERSTVAVVVTISLGCASIVPTAGDSMDTLVLEADKALYAAKHAGKNRIVRADQLRPEDRGLIT